MKLYTVTDIEAIRPGACHKCGGRHCMVIHQYRLRYSQDLFGNVVNIIVVRFKCTFCGTTITVIPCFTHCFHVYDAKAIHACLFHRITTGHYFSKANGEPVCPSWWLQQRWYKDFRYQTGFGESPQAELLARLALLGKPALLLQRHYERMEAYPPSARNPSLHHGLRIVMPLSVE